MHSLKGLSLYYCYFLLYAVLGLDKKGLGLIYVNTESEHDLCIFCCGDGFRALMNSGTVEQNNKPFLS